MKQIVWIINCYLYGAILILLVVLALLVYLRGQANHLPNPFARRNIVYRSKEKAQGVLLGKKFGLLAYSPEQDEGHILVMGPSGTGKTSALLIPTLRSWQGTALVVDISGDISANVHAENKIIFDPTAADCIPYDVFASIDAAPDDTERQERSTLKMKRSGRNTCGILSDGCHAITAKPSLTMPPASTTSVWANLTQT